MPLRVGQDKVMTMDKKTALVALLAVWGVGFYGALSVDANAQTPAEATLEEAAEDGLENRVWVRSDTPDLPGSLKIFLSDGTLVSDSCWETHRFSEWTKTSDTGLSWDEDGMPISAQIVSLTGEELVLALQLGSDTVEERYVPATVPYVCPDMPR